MLLLFQDDIVVQLVVLLAEFLQTLARFDDHLLRNGEHNAHVVRILEALARQAEHTLLRNQCLHELQIRLELGEPADVDADHHVHGPTGHDRTQTADLLDRLVRQFGMSLKGLENIR